MIRKPEERARRFFLPVSVLLVGFLILDIIFIWFLNTGWISGKIFSVLVAPPLEEVIKGGIASLLGILYLVFYAKGRLRKLDPLGLAILAGVLSGVVFALTESLSQGESMLALATGLYTHPIWTTGISLGFWFLLLYGDKKFLAIILPTAIIGHMSWNYYILHPSNLTKSLSFLLIITIITLTTWKYLKTKNKHPT